MESDFFGFDLSSGSACSTVSDSMVSTGDMWSLIPGYDFTQFLEERFNHACFLFPVFRLLSFVVGCLIHIRVIGRRGGFLEGSCPGNVGLHPPTRGAGPR